MMYTETFMALVKEAQFTKEMLGAGATQIRNASYATKGVYFQAFTSLSTGLERIGKLCLMLDYYIESGGKFPDLNYLKNEIGHKISLIYEKSQAVVNNRSIPFTFLKRLDGSIHQNIMMLLSDYAKGDRYSNIDLLIGGKKGNDPVAKWFEKVDVTIFDSLVPASKKTKIADNALIIERMIGGITYVSHSSETGSHITSVQEGSYRTGMQAAVAPHRQLLVLQIIRYWVELLSALQYKAMAVGKQDIPVFSEIFAPFYNDDAYLKSRKTWEKM